MEIHKLAGWLGKQQAEKLKARSFRGFFCVIIELNWVSLELAVRVSRKAKNKR
jgi:hypothetical protein